MDPYFLFAIVVAVAFVWIAGVIYGMDEDVHERIDSLEERYDRRHAELINDNQQLQRKVEQLTNGGQ